MVRKKLVEGLVHNIKYISVTLILSLNFSGSQSKNINKDKSLGAYSHVESNNDGTDFEGKHLWLRTCACVYK